VGGKPADTVVDSPAGQAVLHGPHPGRNGASAAFAFLSAPVDDPTAGSMTDGPTGPDDINEITDAGGVELFAGDRAFDGNGSPDGDGSTDSVMIINGTQAPPGSAFGGKNLGARGEPIDLAARPTGMAEALAASVQLPDAMIAPEALTAPACRASAAWDASDIVTEIYEGHYKQLVRLALLLVHDMQTAEEVVQDAFESMHMAWRRLRDSEKALSYLRQIVVNRSRSVLRHRKVVDMHPPKPAPDEPSAEHAVLALLERSAVVSALRLLPERQREAVVLRYYADLSEADIAKAMGISRGAVKSHTARAMAALKSSLEQRMP
jgi:RNA polymerase sigma-70 factor (sigma-E family)